MRRFLPILGALAILSHPAVMSGSILTFDIFDSSDPRLYPVSEDFPEGYAVDQQYGDRVTSGTQTIGPTTFEYGEGGEGFTPNVVVEYGPASILTGGPSLWRYDYGDLVRVLYQGSTVGDGTNNNYLLITLRADYGYDALLYGFDLGGWFQTDYEINSVSVYDAQFNGFFPELNRVFHDPNAVVLGAGPTHASYVFNSPIRGNVISILIDANNLGDTSELIGVDNIRIGQDIDPDPGPAPVPEPATAMLMAAGLGLLALRARRR